MGFGWVIPTGNVQGNMHNFKKLVFFSASFKMACKGSDADQEKMYLYGGSREADLRHRWP